MSSVTLPQELIDAINNVGFWDSIPLWAVTLIGGLLDYGFIFYHDPHGLRQNVQPVDICSHCTDSAVYLCG